MEFQTTAGKCGNMRLCPKTAWPVPSVFTSVTAKQRKKSQVYAIYPLISSARGRRSAKTPVDTPVPGAVMDLPQAPGAVLRPEALAWGSDMGLSLGHLLGVSCPWCVIWTKTTHQSESFCNLGRAFQILSLKLNATNKATSVFYQLVPSALAEHSPCSQQEHVLQRAGPRVTRQSGGWGRSSVASLVILLWADGRLSPAWNAGSSLFILMLDREQRMGKVLDGWCVQPATFCMSYRLWTKKTSLDLFNLLQKF